MTYIIFFLSFTFIAIMIVPFVEWIYYRILGKEEEIFIFPNEVYDAEWPENGLIKTNYEEFKKRKKKAFQKELP